MALTASAQCSRLQSELTATLASHSKLTQQLSEAEEASDTECGRLRQEILSMHAQNEVSEQGRESEDILSYMMQAEEATFECDRLKNEYSELQACEEALQRWRTMAEKRYEELKRCLIGSEEASAMERCDLRAEVLALQTEDAELRKQLTRSETQAARSTASASASAAEINGLRTELSTVKMEKCQLWQELVKLEEMAPMSQSLLTSSSFFPTAAETAAAKAAEMEQQRWDSLWRQVLEPLKQRSVELESHCQVERCAFRNAELQADRWRAEAEALARGQIEAALI
jgi:hypothetical protein